MTLRSWRRTTMSAVGALALTATFAATAPSALAAPQPKADPVSLFPSNSLTVPDGRQLTGRRVALPTQNCGPAITCGLVQRLNELDGFDLDPRLAVTFSAPVDPAQMAQRITVQESRGGWRTGVDRVVYDRASNTVYAHPAEQLAPGTTYRLSVQGGPANKAAQDTFTTMSATDGLVDLRRQIDVGGRALGAVGIAPGLRVEGTFPAAGTTVDWAQDRGTVDPAPAPVPTQQLPAGSLLVFGSYLAPSWLQPDVTIRQTPTRDFGPLPVAAARLPFVAVLPAGKAPAGGWPVAVFGHGFTSSTNAAFLAATTNAAEGIATIATNVVGHGYGPGSTWRVTSGGTTTTLPAYGRGIDQDGDGDIEASEGSSASGGAAAVSSRDALRQTAADIMTLVRSLDTDVDGDRSPDLSGRGVTYFGQSFGGIYGSMLTGADPAISRAVLNVPGGPITEIARLAPAFRLLTTQSLQAAGLLNSQDRSRAFFQEQLPLRGEGPVTATVPGALAIQDHLAKATWLSRPGSPETFAPLIDDRRVLLQVALGDQTVPNPTSYTLVDAGDLWSRTSLYRHDRTGRTDNPHSFLLNPDNPAWLQGLAQVSEFLRSGRVADPDGTGAVWEVPINDPAVLLPLNFPNPALRP
ncbi:Ig-like domain-containing protein [Blastococcus haudaquaticus]|uniref:Ig-like domain-containing protein n=1 Tax=Blastococcus haudaquaticus TaxID=1938745 RepID=A0A286GIT7_9ACTN|nr:Ig-like domain-containing protein [Blastococcus haudaquaticus]SOD95453.1 Ig-like domain-containing protein [Blastococcus haudaquaticus]